MVAIAAPSKLMTPEEYLDFERKAEYWHEYWDGRLRERAASSRAHCLISGNIASEIGNQLVCRECEVYQTNMRVRVSPRKYFYPDVVAVCGEVRLADDHFDTLLNPTVVIETLSPSTEDDDRGDKGKAYRRLESLQEYVLIAQNKVHIEHHVRQAERWTKTEISDLKATLNLSSIGCQIALRDIYDKVPFLNDAASENKESV